MLGAGNQVRTGRAESQTRSGRGVGKQSCQCVTQNSDSVVAHQNTEFTRTLRRVEIRLCGEDAFDAVECEAHTLPQLGSQGTQVIFVAHAVEQVVVEMPAQPAECGRQRRLAQSQLIRSLRHAAMLKQCIE